MEKRKKFPVINFLIFFFTVIILFNIYTAFVTNTEIGNIETDNSIVVEASVLAPEPHHDYGSVYFTYEYNSKTFYGDIIDNDLTYSSDKSILYLHIDIDTGEYIYTRITNPNLVPSILMSLFGPITTIVFIYIVYSVTKKHKNNKPTINNSYNYDSFDNKYGGFNEVDKEDPFAQENCKYNIEKEDPFEDFYKKK